jgi:hypothetical protein
MFCPACKAEYVEGVTFCPDCQVSLVADLPDPTAESPIEFEDVLSTYNQGDIAMLKSLLDDAEIEYHFKTEFFNQFEPLIQPAVLAVRKDQIAGVRKMLEGMKFSFLGIANRPE